MARDSSKRGNIRSFFETNAPAIAFLLIVLVVWQVVTTTMEIPSWFIPSPLVIIDAFSSTRYLWKHTYITLIEAFSDAAAAAWL